MKMLSQRWFRGILTAVAAGMLVMLSSPVQGQDAYLALAGENGTIQLRRVSDFSKVATIDVTPMTDPWIRFLPLTRHLYVWDEVTTLNTVLDFGTCSSGLLHPLNIPNPLFVGANGAESTLFISSVAADIEGHSADAENAIYMVDTSTDTVTGLLERGQGWPGESIFDPDRNELYVWWGDLKVYDSDLRLLRECNLGDSGRTVIARSKIYSVGGYVPGVIGDVFVFDAVTCNFIRALQYPNVGQEEVAVRTRAGDKVYVLTHMDIGDHGNPNFLSWNAVNVIDTLTDQVSAFPLGRELDNRSSMVLSADETTAYIAMAGMDWFDWVVDAPARDGKALGVLNLQTGVMQQYPIDVTPSNDWGLALIDRLGFQCGDGIVETACGEQCDPPGSVVNGTVCDVNCTLGCGNGIASGSEQCDDGNTNNNDACKNDCTWNVCGDGVVNRGVEQCDDGASNGTPGDACNANCTLPPRTASSTVAAGGTLTTDVEGDGATAAAPVETWVTSPLTGSVSIDEGAPDPTTPSGYAFLGYSVHVTVPSSTADNPIQLVFEVHSSLLPQGSNQTAVEFSKNGEIVFDCAAGGSAASPDPCVASRELLANGNLRISIRSSTASYWGGLAPWHDARVMPLRGVSLMIPARKLLVTRKIPVRVRNADPFVSGKKASTPIQLTATNVDCPLGLIADVADFNARKPFAQDSVTLAPQRTGTAKLRLVASRFAFPKSSSPLHCTIKLSAAALVVDNVDPTPADNTTTVKITVTTR